MKKLFLGIFLFALSITSCYATENRVTLQDGTGLELGTVGNPIKTHCVSGCSGAGSITAADTGIIYSDGANNPVADATNFHYDKTLHYVYADAFITKATNTPQSQYNPLVVGDTKFTAGVNGNGDAANNDHYVISEGGTLGTNNRFDIAPGGSTTITTLLVTTINGSTVPSSATLVGTTDTLSQRINPRTNTVASTATPAINTDTTDVFTITALATNITSMTSSLTGTPVNGQSLLIRITGTAARTISWGASFEASTDLALPTTTTTTKTLYCKFIYNSTAAKWDLVAKLDNF